MRWSVATMDSRSGKRAATAASIRPAVASRKGLSLIRRAGRGSRSGAGGPGAASSPHAIIRAHDTPIGGHNVSARPYVLEFGMGVDVHGLDGTTAACRAVSDAIRHSSLPLFADVRARGGTMLVDVTVGVPDPASVDVERVRKELPHGEVTVRAVPGGLQAPGSDTLIACAAITVSVESPG